MTPPASFTRTIASASCFGTKFLYAGKPQVVGRPATLKDSLAVRGMPSSGLVSPRVSAVSADRAASSAREKSRTQTALILPSCRSMRPIASCASSTAETFLALSATESSRAVLKLHGDLATAHPISIRATDACCSRSILPIRTYSVI
jgi:hypothetical protein